MSALDHDGVSLHWEASGAGSPVLLIMGSVYSSAMWYPTLPALEARHHVVRFDNRGTGRSTWTPTTSIAQMAGDALAVLDAAGLENAHVYGISLGGVIAMELALLAPERVRSLVLGCTCVLTPDKPRAPLELNDALRTASREELVAATLYGDICPPEAKAEHQRTLLEDVAVPEALVAQQDALRAYNRDLADVATLTMPALVLHGTDDPIVPVDWGRELAATLPDSRLSLYEGCGHLYAVEMGDQPNDEVLSFLAEVDAASETAGQPVSAL